ncbi:MAG: hypothetical protein OEV80_14910, partial [candidate division Zixibacteria bacterium]|nr:hypothetical protein [candidate division Zixibacteria bacterium]
MKVPPQFLASLVIVIGSITISSSARDNKSEPSPHPFKSETEQRAKSLHASAAGLTSFGLHRTAKIEATVNCNGTAGSGYYPGVVPADTGAPDLSFITPPGSQVEYLYGMAVWVGGIVGTDTLVSVGADGWSTGGGELFAPLWSQSGSMAEVDHIADNSLTA